MSVPLIGVHENEDTYQFSKDQSLALYRKKVESYIKENQDDLTIQRIKRNQPITKLDLEQLDNKLLKPVG